MSVSVLKNGFSTIMTFGTLASSAYFLEVELQPPGLDMGGEIDVTTMRNSTWRTRQPKSLKTLTGIKCSAAYDPAFFAANLALLGLNQLITITFPNGHTLAVYGFLDKATPNTHKEGERPTIELEIVCTNLNNATPQAETAPVYV